MSEILVDNLTGKTSAGDVTITSEGGSATMQLQQGVAKHWANWDGTGTVSVRDSLNTSSITDSGTGLYRPVMANPMNAADYSVGKSTSNYCHATSSTSYSDTTTEFYCYVQDTSGTFTDAAGNYTQTFGDLA